MTMRPYDYECLNDTECLRKLGHCQQLQVWVMG